MTHLLLFIGNLGGPEILLLSALALIPLAIWIYALIDVVKGEFKDSTTKLTWLVVVIFLQFIGAVIYLLAGKQQKLPPPVE